MKGTGTNVAANRQLARDFLDLPMYARRRVLISVGLIDDSTPWDPTTARTTTVDAFADAARTNRLGQLRLAVTDEQERRG